MDSRLILQVHDEVILEVPPDEEERAAAMVMEEMTGAAVAVGAAGRQPVVGRHLGRRQGMSPGPAGSGAGPSAVEWVGPRRTGERRGRWVGVCCVRAGVRGSAGRGGLLR